MFGEKKLPDLEFKTRAEAYKYILTYLVAKGKDPIEAATEADKFVELYSKNVGLVDDTIPQPKGIDKYISGAQKIGNFLQENPKLIELGVPLITFIAGLFTGKKVEECEKQEYESIQKEFINPENLD